MDSSRNACVISSSWLNIISKVTFLGYCSIQSLRLRASRSQTQPTRGLRKDQSTYQRTKLSRKRLGLESISRGIIELNSPSMLKTSCVLQSTPTPQYHSRYEISGMRQWLNSNPHRKIQGRVWWASISLQLRHLRSRNCLCLQVTARVCMNKVNARILKTLCDIELTMQTLPPRKHILLLSTQPSLSLYIHPKHLGRLLEARRHLSLKALKLLRQLTRVHHHGQARMKLSNLTLQHYGQKIMQQDQSQLNEFLRLERRGKAMTYRWNPLRRAVGR